MLRVAFGENAAAPLRILCIGAHADDIEIGCGGTLLRLLTERPGSSLRWVVLSATPERETEAGASALDFLGDAGGDISIASFRERYFPYVEAEIKDYFEKLKPVAPDVIFCHRRDDMHRDHRVAAELTWNTFRDHLILEYEIPKYEGDLGTPDVFVPLSRDLAERKVGLIMEHFASQRGRSWFRPDTFHGLMSVRGVECNAPEGRAEAFYARKLVV